MLFKEKLEHSWEKSDSFVCAGLDPDVDRLPQAVRDAQYPIFEFNRALIDATADLVCAYKPQIAYYAAAGAEDQLEMTIEHIRKRDPQIVVILDAKRGDIGSTARMYAREAFERYGADAVTVNPYMGTDTLEPFINEPSHGAIVLCKTSNPGSGDFQDLDVGQERLYLSVARKVATLNANGNILLVVGATYPEQLAEIRRIVPEVPFLVPGVGAQGGDIRQVISSGIRADGLGLIINSSRGIIYASGGEDFAEAARQKTLELRDGIRQAMQ